ncbi:unnamed protein product [Allacma fusca]|uniref:Uncharacterized protein n=1 Tax=Allacma fusca TaxID=39272 RepID=A0A8J2J599_9HEXA|nr:unnamed protein product [Allacma fusca]
MGGGGGGSSQGHLFRKRRKCVIPKATFTTFMDEGVMHYRAGHYRKALFCFNRVRSTLVKCLLVLNSQT